MTDVIAFGFIAEGDLNDFDADRQSKLTDRLGYEAGCSQPQCAVSAKFQPGSLSVGVEFIFRKDTAALDAVQAYTNTLQSESLSRALQINVTSVSAADTFLNVTQLVPPAPPSPPVSEAGIRALMFFAGVLCCLAVQVCGFWCLKRRAKARAMAAVHAASAAKYVPEEPAEVQKEQPPEIDWRERLKIGGAKAGDTDAGDTDDAGESGGDTGGDPDAAVASSTPQHQSYTPVVTMSKS